MEALRQWLVGQGWSEAAAVVAVIGVGLVTAYFAAEFFRLAGRWLLRRMRLPTQEWVEAFESRRVMRGFGWVIAIMVADAQITPLIDQWNDVMNTVETLFSASLVVAVVVAFNRLVGAIADALEARDGTSHRMPYKVIGQAVQLVLWTYGALVFIAVVSHRDVTNVLTGLTALGAVLVYVFRDPLLGWTAGVQLAANDLANTGDWIEVPQHGADGTVVDITLTTVKVQNWDATITMVPSYSLISEGFKNYRAMFESGGRRIKRAIAVDANSVEPCDEALLERLRKSDLGAEALEGISASAGSLLDGVQFTNLACYRRWLEGWLGAHPLLSEDKTLMVRELAPVGRGIPVEIYAFTSDTAWVAHEHTQADVLDQAFAALPEFGLRLFQEPTGEDLKRLGG